MKYLYEVEWLDLGNAVAALHLLGFHRRRGADGAQTPSYESVAYQSPPPVNFERRCILILIDIPLGGLSPADFEVLNHFGGLSQQREAE